MSIRGSSFPLESLRRSSWPFVEMFLPFPGNPFSPSRPLAGPSQASSNPLVALRRSSWPFVDIFLPFPGNPFSPARPLAEPSRAFSNAFVALRRSSWPFVEIFLPFPGNLFPLPDHWRIPLKPSPTPWWPFVVLPAPSWITLFLSPHKFVPHPIDWAGYPVRSRLWGEPAFLTGWPASDCEIP